MEAHERRFPDGEYQEDEQTVHGGRAAGPWTPAVHALLRHLEAVGFEGAPRALGIDAHGRELRTFIPGETIPASLEGYRSDEVLRLAARLLRRYHDATATFEPPHDAVWQPDVGAPSPGDVICHNDIGPYNTVAVEGSPIAFIDFDCAAPGPREWDIAHALWRFVPLYGDEVFGPPAERARRITVFCDAYGFTDRRGILEIVERREIALYDSLQLWSARYSPTFLKLWRELPQAETMRDLHYLRHHRAELEDLLGR